MKIILKKLFILTIMLAGTAIVCHAQNRSIRFEESANWEKLVKKASREKKLMFIDCYTSWCGPCKLLVKNIFSRDSVADFFNAHFINLKLDVEKDPVGVLVKNNYPVVVYPTLLFIDPQTREMVHCITGYGTTEWLIANGLKAINPENNLKGLKKRYDTGERNLDFLCSYMDILRSAFQKEEQETIAIEYLNSIPQQQWATPSTWEFINKYVSNPLSTPLQYVMEHRHKFQKFASPGVVERKLEKTLWDMTNELSSWSKSWDTPFDNVAYDKLINYLQNLSYAPASSFLAYLYASRCVREKDYLGLLSTLQECFKYNVFRQGEKMEFLFRFLDHFWLCEDAGARDRLIVWIERQFQPENSDGLYTQLLEKKELFKQ